MAKRKKHEINLADLNTSINLDDMLKGLNEEEGGGAADPAGEAVEEGSPAKSPPKSPQKKASRPKTSRSGTAARKKTKPAAREDKVSEESFSVGELDWFFQPRPKSDLVSIYFSQETKDLFFDVLTRAGVRTPYGQVADNIVRHWLMEHAPELRKRFNRDPFKQLEM